MTRLVDLSTPVRTGHFRWAVERRLAKSHDTGAGQATWAGWNVHAFTHMDSPRHVDPEGFTTDAISLDMTVGPGAVLDVSDVPANSAIPAERLAAAGAHLRQGDFALIRTRWDERASLDTPEFWLNAPWMTAEGAIWLRERGIKAVGFDFPQDHCIRNFLTGEPRPPLPEHVTHYHLLARGVIMFEYLCNMGALRQARNTVVGLPIRLPDSDGAPARVIVMEDAP
ncbi:cyclase family protein [Roseomonas sp. AR75]|jgi:arylformamidase|uniref:cyclase family protein n=1 Tax=Roseomonas sp. AR75 TaxID=2562311 RepID=UPI0010C05AD9|nr:cyclase family protein [Roseomonas sp. AR75]